MTGVLVTFLGIDGIGKSTLAAALSERLRAGGAEVVDGSWRGALHGSADPWPRQALQQLWLETYRCLYGGARTDEGPVTLPRHFDAWDAGGHEDALGRLAVRTNGASGALASALVELAGNVLLFAEVIRPALARGAVVVQETFPFKHILKELLIARRLAGGAPGTPELVGQLEQLLRSFFAAPLLRPDVGVLVDGPAELAYGWRRAQSGGLGALEDFGAAGERGWQSYRELQERSAEGFRSVAAEWGWLVHRVDDGGLAANVARGLALVAGHPRLAGRLPAAAHPRG